MPSNEGLAGELKKLAELHASGVLSDEEFAAAKGRLLEQSESSGRGAKQSPSEKRPDVAGPKVPPDDGSDAPPGGP